MQIVSTIASFSLSLRTDEWPTEVPKVLCGVAVDVAHILAFEVELIGGRDVYGQVVKLVDDEIEVHGGRGTDGPHGNSFTLLRIGKRETVVDPSGSQVLTSCVKILFRYANRFQGIQYLVDMIPGYRKKHRNPPRLPAYVHRESCPNHRTKDLRHRGT